MSLGWISDPWVPTVSNGKVCTTCREVISISDTTEPVFVKAFCLCTWMPCLPLVLCAIGFAIAMCSLTLQTRDTAGCFSTLRLSFQMVPHVLKVAGEIFPGTGSHWYRRPGQWSNSDAVRDERACNSARAQPWSSPSPVTSSQPALVAGVHEMWQRLTGVKTKVVLKAGCGVDCLCELLSCFLQVSSKLFPIILEAYLGIVFLLSNSRETCLERGPSYFS